MEIIANKADLIYDRQDKLVEHWKIERILAQYEGIKGVQLVQICAGAPVCKRHFRVLGTQFPICRIILDLIF